MGLFIKNLLILLLFYLCTSFGYAHTSEVDSLKQALDQHRTNDSVKIDILSKLSFAYSTLSPSIADKYGKQALKIAKRLDYPTGVAQAYQVCGITYARIGNFDQALSCYFEALQLHERLGLEEEAADDIHNIAGIYFYQKDYDQALEFAHRALDNQLKDEDWISVANGYQSIGMIHQGMDEYDEALIFYQKALLKYRQLKAKNSEGGILLNMGSLMQVQGNYQGALESYLQALKLYEQTNNQLGMADIHSHIGHMYTLLNRYQTADAYLSKAMKLSRTGNFMREKKDTHLFFAILDSARGRYEGAFYHYQQFIKIRDSLNDLRTKKQMAEVKAQFEVYQKEQEVDLLYKESALQEAEIRAKEATIRKQTWIVIATSLLMTFLAISVSFLIYNNQQQRKARAEIEAQSIELEALNRSKSQWFSIISHDFRSPLTFLQGALTLINEGNLTHHEAQMITTELEARVKQTSTMLDNLLYWAQSELRDITPNPRKIKLQSLLREVLSFYQAEIDRKGILLQTVIDDQALVEIDREMLNLILRNIMGNSVAFSPAEGSIVVRTQTSEDRILIMIEDQGAPISPEQLPILFTPHNPTEVKHKRLRKGGGLGLWLSRKFMEKNFGALWVESGPEKGVTFILELPIAEEV